MLDTVSVIQSIVDVAFRIKHGVFKTYAQKLTDASKPAFRLGHKIFISNLQNLTWIQDLCR